MTAFEQAFALLKMPFVPGSVRAKEGEFMEGDDDHAPAQKYVGDFYDPVDDRTLPIEIEPQRKWVGPDNPKGGFGRKHDDMDRMDAAFIPMDDLEPEREPERMFGMNQYNPFAAVIDNKIDRVFVPSDMRRRKIAAGLLDALEEYRTKFGGWREGSMVPDKTNTGDMLGLLASRGLFPRTMARIDNARNHGDQEGVQYMHGEWADNARWLREGLSPSVPQEQWMEEWQKAGKRYAAQQEMWEDEGW